MAWVASSLPLATWNPARDSEISPKSPASRSSPRLGESRALLGSQIRGGASLPRTAEGSSEAGGHRVAWHGSPHAWRLGSNMKERENQISCKRTQTCLAKRVEMTRTEM